MKIAIEQIIPSPEPVRTQMEPAKLDELSASIKEQGLIVPIKVRPIDDKYEIVYGHRRFTASQMVGLQEVECIVEGVDDPLIQALVENVVREDMNDADVRDGLRQLKELTGKEWAEIGAMFGWSEVYTKSKANIKDDEAEVIRSNAGITFEHVSRSRKAGEDSVKVLEKAAKEGLSKRQVEAVAKSVANTLDPKRKQHLIDTPYSPYTHDPEYAQERANKYGASDPVSFDKSPSKTDTWKDTPEVVVLLRYIKEAKEQMGKIVTMKKEGKFAPEALPFVASKLKGLAKDIQLVIEVLESE